ncbi:mediator of RNA polymerase II transcription subunit 4, putative [Plasmodium chabaudi chabaudi]|uniref:Mediator of RNA polymerase II transcription subunit 4, putative n=1 Tax=Plasmodium chabaudi chabaudi TaxID=31271 RepID=A0A077TT17_PLACU|nr:mediator of RNA polymerase II transcription subunit 4, putative [Plasmodium chabaudi chabaudi]SCM04922.1 conserved Plasmodium protein, unknown function [Plasmodium chabaudi chabaudi]VTZ70284.1 mediator of RNA polymerase II transcription subunit 4, putative [Plasmodium chabaudi chabaudi]|eukprot:XP_740804.2 conserved Plasmodium protein, unknown function [Plasmodium chabaudi chabaudi]
MTYTYKNTETPFHEIVLTIKERIEKHDISKWENIVKPEDEHKYNEYFENFLKKEDEANPETCQKNIEEEDCNHDENETNDKIPYHYNINNEFFDNINNRERFYFLLNIKDMMETTWLLVQKRLEGIDLEESSEPVNVQELIKYSKQISDTTCAPPECNNINDSLIHHEYYPNYHFLNFVNIEEIHLSKLFQLQKYSKVCFPPIITIREDNNNNNRIIIDITCSTPKTTIYYKINDDIKESIYDTNNKPIINKKKKVYIYAWSIRPGYMKSRVSCISKAYLVDEQNDSLAQGDIDNEQSQHSLDSSKSASAKKAPEKSNKTTNVFKSLGFLLSRKKEAASDNSSDEKSSSN